jgi:hypothetical protein
MLAALYARSALGVLVLAITANAKRGETHDGQ